jgi:NADH oxidase (H2O2-forming)
MKLAVVGSGAAANAAAFAARRIDASLSITIFSEDGLPLYSPCLLPQYLASSLSRDRMFLKTTHDYFRARIDYLHQKVTGIELQAGHLSTNGGTFAYDRLILAMGSRAKRPAIDGIDKQGVFSLKGLEDSDRILSSLGHRVAVIGSGNIGIEAALALRKKGCKVSLFETEAIVNPVFFPAPFSNAIQKGLESEGIEVVTGSHITQILGHVRADGLVDRGTFRPFDLIINATGVVPNAEIARQAGLAIGPKGGVLVDDCMRTSNPSVYACGDCVELSDDEYAQETRLGGLWPNAIRQGSVAGSNATGMPKKNTGLFDLRFLKIKDSFAISLGWNEKDLAGVAGIDYIDQHPSPDILIRVCLFEGKLVAARLWGKAWKLGPLISCIHRKWDWNMLSGILKNRNALCRYPFLGQLQFLFPG